MWISLAKKWTLWKQWATCANDDLPQSIVLLTFSDRYLSYIVGFRFTFEEAQNFSRLYLGRFAFINLKLSWNCKQNKFDRFYIRWWDKMRKGLGMSIVYFLSFLSVNRSFMLLTKIRFSIVFNSSREKWLMLLWIDKLVLQKKLHGTVTMLFYYQEWLFDLHL